MKLKYTVIAAVVLTSLASVSASARVFAPLAPTGSNWSRAAMPMHRGAQYISVTKVGPGDAPARSVLVATHIGGPIQNDVVASTRVAPSSQVIASASPTR